MSMERYYQIVRDAVAALPMIELIAGPSHPWLNWRAAMCAARTIERMR